MKSIILHDAINELELYLKLEEKERKRKYLRLKFNLQENIFDIFYDLHSVKRGHVEHKCTEEVADDVEDHVFGVVGLPFHLIGSDLPRLKGFIGRKSGEFYEIVTEFGISNDCLRVGNLEMYHGQLNFDYKSVKSKLSLRIAAMLVNKRSKDLKEIEISCESDGMCSNKRCKCFKEEMKLMPCSFQTILWCKNVIHSAALIYIVHCNLNIMVQLVIIYSADCIEALLKYVTINPITKHFYYPFAQHPRFKFSLYDRLSRHRTIDQTKVIQTYQSLI
ncbi:hypothetical protein BpHYR1_004529 [Brachionus plicatilis]|uniref:Uncharacterized protein n=1 Tax=Brachionus plicatilis TaxID=10195 RepID=A0A3M7P3J3_BRAPC|nr:hypothetical protein BpHYR1_004529 [Brachionus plicatilis]